MKVIELKSENELKEIALRELEFSQVLEIISKYAYSELGKNLILKSDLFEDIAALTAELHSTEEFRRLILRGEYPPLDGLSNVYNFIYKSQIENAVLNTSEIIAILDTCRVSRLVHSFFKSKEDDYPLLFNKSSELFENKLLEKHINETIDDTGNVRDTASRELYRIRQSIIEKSTHLRNRLNRILKKVSEDEYTREDFITIRDGRFVIPIKAESKRQIPGIIHGISQTGATAFLEPTEIIELNNELSLLENEEKREIYRILANLTGEIRDNSKEILKSLDILSHFDAQIAKAKWSLDYGGIEPKIVEDNYVYLKNIKHPLLALSKGLQNVVPLSIEFTQQKRGYLISGPNAGGKTVALKTIGINLALAMSGIFPLGECTTNLRKIYTAIGDNQSIQNDLSTFSAQITRIRDIISNSFADSLILIDEICSGTDPAEGSALASGILETFVEMNVFFLATTHQSTLKTFALSVPEIENASLEFDEKHFRPTYRFQVGVPGNSFAFYLSKNLGLQDIVLRRARKYLDTDHTEVEKAIKLLQFYQQKALQTLNEAQTERNKAKKTYEEYNQKYQSFKQQRANLMKEAREEATRVLESANATIEHTIQQVREEKKSISQIKKEFAEEKKKIIEPPIENEVVEEILPQIEILDEQNQKDLKLEVGGFARYSENNEVGEILEIDNNKGLATVDFHGVKFKLKTKLLTPVSKKYVEEQYIHSSGYTKNIKFDAPSRIDIHGMRVDAALPAIDKFISDAILGNIDRIVIVHGKGSGALKQAVHEFLRSHQSIKSFHEGDLLEGGAGVTIVEL
ncbi:MAG TPA: endonuclease MutS2 [Bacteroidota bacterium]|nr:endonuclease MutS2 [Bacteroidota bacterium]